MEQALIDVAEQRICGSTLSKRQLRFIQMLVADGLKQLHRN
jgi:hypothetical protein